MLPHKGRKLIYNSKGIHIHLQNQGKLNLMQDNLVYPTFLRTQQSSSQACTALETRISCPKCNPTAKQMILKVARKCKLSTLDLTKGKLKLQDLIFRSKQSAWKSLKVFSTEYVMSFPLAIDGRNFPFSQRGKHNTESLERFPHKWPWNTAINLQSQKLD